VEFFPTYARHNVWRPSFISNLRNRERVLYGLLQLGAALHRRVSQRLAPRKMLHVHHQLGLAPLNIDQREDLNAAQNVVRRSISANDALKSMLHAGPEKLGTITYKLFAELNAAFLIPRRSVPARMHVVLPEGSSDVSDRRGGARPNSRAQRLEVRCAAPSMMADPHRRPRAARTIVG
jgi:hypothetical protein